MSYDTGDASAGKCEEYIHHAQCRDDAVLGDVRRARHEADNCADEFLKQAARCGHVAAYRDGGEVEADCEGPVDALGIDTVGVSYQQIHIVPELKSERKKGERGEWNLHAMIVLSFL